ncbi:unnamed protein product [Orchesella dallaii]|uniref:Uncharacterized protein n=1 Tax=Orchesella dallaii TaxID=48710 RepID=A0ABP1R6X0_9HEXA
MSSVEGGTKKMKGHEDEMVLLKQFMTARESIHLLCKTRLDVRLLHENITDEFLQFATQQVQWLDLATELFDKIVKPDQENMSFQLFEDWKLIRDKYDAVKKDKEDLQLRLNGAILEFKEKEKQLVDPGKVDQFVFVQTMSTKQRKKLLKVCKNNEDIVGEEMTKFETFKEEWEAIKVDMNCCIQQLEKLSCTLSESSL